MTGDLGEFDADGYLWFRGRLKRFLKAGGEMISLPALEEPFARLYPPTKDGPRVAVEGVEQERGRRIVLFTTEPLDLREANALLLKEGFHGVMRLDDVRRVEENPGPGDRQDRLQAASCPDPGEHSSGKMSSDYSGRKENSNPGPHPARRQFAFYGDADSYFASTHNPVSTSATSTINSTGYRKVAMGSSRGTWLP